MQNITGIMGRYLSDINLPSMNIIDIIEIILISFFVYQFMVWIKFTRAYTLLKGLLVIGAFLVIAYIFKMNTILWIVSRLAGALITAIVVIFQPELRNHYSFPDITLPNNTVFLINNTRFNKPLPQYLI